MFPFAVILWIICNSFSYKYFLFGLILISIISFIDDIFKINQLIRFSGQIIASYLLLYELDLFLNNLIILLIILVVIIGWLNVYNFMDGINGMMAMYSMTTFISFFFLYLQNQFIDINFIFIMISSLLIFSFFNIRRNAVMFSGDIGSISLAYIIAFTFLLHVRDSFNFNYILFFSIYGIESVVTILERLYNRENIFKAHRSHLYQYLANEKKISHITISLIYSFIQLLINLFVIYFIVPINISLISFMFILLFLTFIYVVIKYFVLLSIKNRKRIV